MNSIPPALRNAIRTALWASLLLICFFCLTRISPAQQPASAAPAQAALDQSRATPTQLKEEAWTMLRDATQEKKPESRIDAISALGDLGGRPEAEKLIANALNDPDIDVRSSAILAASNTRSKILAAKLKPLLDDKEPQIAFTAASALWRMGDHSGADLLISVVQGERKASASILNGSMHQANKDLHNPVAIAKITAPFFLGPFGIGLAAYNYMHKPGGDSPRVIGVELLSEQKTPAIRDELIDALGDKDPAVRETAARELGGFHDRSIATHLTSIFVDPKLSVRLAAAAAYIRITEGSTTPLQPRHMVAIPNHP